VGVFRVFSMAAARWYVLVPLVLVSLGVAWVAYTQMPALYTASAVYQVNAPADGAGSDTPFADTKATAAKLVRDIAPRPPGRGQTAPPPYVITARADSPMIDLHADSNDPDTALNVVKSVSTKLNDRLAKLQLDSRVSPDAQMRLDIAAPSAVAPPVRTTGVRVFAATLVFGLMLSLVIAAAVERTARRRRDLLDEFDPEDQDEGYADDRESDDYPPDEEGDSRDPDRDPDRRAGDEGDSEDELDPVDSEAPTSIAEIPVVSDEPDKSPSGKASPEEVPATEEKAQAIAADAPSTDHDVDGESVKDPEAGEPPYADTVAAEPAVEPVAPAASPGSSGGAPAMDAAFTSIAAFTALGKPGAVKGAAEASAAVSFSDADEAPTQIGAIAPLRDGRGAPTRSLDGAPRERPPIPSRSNDGNGPSRSVGGLLGVHRPVAGPGPVGTGMRMNGPVGGRSMDRPTDLGAPPKPSRGRPRVMPSGPPSEPPPRSTPMRRPELAASAPSASEPPNRRDLPAGWPDSARRPGPVQRPEQIPGGPSQRPEPASAGPPPRQGMPPRPESTRHPEQGSGGPSARPQPAPPGPPSRPGMPPRPESAPGGPSSRPEPASAGAQSEPVVGGPPPRPELSKGPESPAVRPTGAVRPTRDEPPGRAGSGLAERTTAMQPGQSPRPLLAVQRPAPTEQPSTPPAERNPAETPAASLAPKAPDQPGADHPIGSARRPSDQDEPIMIRPEQAAKPPVADAEGVSERPAPGGEPMTAMPSNQVDTPQRQPVPRPGSSVQRPDTQAEATTALRPGPPGTPPAAHPPRPEAQRAPDRPQPPAGQPDARRQPGSTAAARGGPVNRFGGPDPAKFASSELWAPVTPPPEGPNRWLPADTGKAHGQVPGPPARGPEPRPPNGPRPPASGARRPGNAPAGAQPASVPPGGRPMNGRPVNGPSDARPGNPTSPAQPGNGHIGNGPADARPRNAPASGPASGQPANGRPPNGPVNGHPPSGRPTNQPAQGQPAQGQPGNGRPANANQPEPNYIPRSSPIGQIRELASDEFGWPDFDELATEAQPDGDTGGAAGQVRPPDRRERPREPAAGH
jgi:hypothetical protein